MTAYTNTQTLIEKRSHILKDTQPPVGIIILYSYSNRSNIRLYVFDEGKGQDVAGNEDRAVLIYTKTRSNNKITSARDVNKRGISFVNIANLEKLK